MELGHRVLLPTIDTGIDFVVNERIRVQVKSARLTGRNSGAQNVYAFSVKPSNRTADIFILHGYTDDRWWIVPRDAIELSSVKALINLNVSHQPNPNGRGRPSRHHALLVYEDAWHLFEEDKWPAT